MPRPSSLPVALLGTAALVWSAPAEAVELTGQVRGVVTDADGLAVPGVTVNLTSPDLLGGRSAVTGPDGSYRFISLPPGDYLLVAEMAGFAPAEVRFRVATGLSTKVDVVIVPQVAGEEITVVDTAPVVDTTSTRTGVVMTKEMIRDIPNAGRDYQGVTEFAPGVNDNGTGNPNVRGSVSYGNQYYVDGVNTTDPLTNTFSMNMNFDAIEEVQVITGGMDAEYGRAMGGAVNIVTRSGGNEYEGDVQILYNNTGLQIYKPLPEELEASDADGDGKLSNDELPARQDVQMALNLGGPIIQDRLWFFTSVQANSFVSTPIVPEDVNRPEPMQSRDWKSAYLFGKLTWRPADAHKIWVQGQADPTNINNADSSIYTLPSAEYWWQQGGWLASAGHQWTPDTNTLVETQLSTSSNYIRLRPTDWKECKASDYDDDGYCGVDFTDDLGAWQAYDPDGFSYGPFPYAYYTERKRTSLTFAATRFFSALGEHQAKVGVQADLLNTRSVYPGLEQGIVYYQHAGDPADLEGYSPRQLVQYESNLDTPLKGNLISWYVQDAWQPVDRVTLRPGLRFDTSSFQDNAGNTVYSTFTVAPRIGGALDVTGDGRTRLHAYWGRFYDSGFLEISDILAKGENGYSVYSWSDQIGDWNPNPDYSVASQFLVHPDLKVPVSDELDIGVARDVGDGWSLASTFTYEHARNLFEDDEVNLIWNEEGTSVIGSRDGTGDTYYRLRTPDEAFIKYTSLEFQANRQFGEKWGLLSSYTWSRAYGRARDDVSQGLASASFDIPTQMDEEVGLMPYDVPHAVKLAGSYRDAWAWELGGKTAVGYLFGWNFQMSSGYPYRPVYYTPYYGDWYTYREPIDGSYRLPAYSRTDLKAGITVAQGRTRWDVTAECFNVFNNRTTTDVFTAVEDSSGEPYTNDDGEILFGSTQARQRPRYFQLGLRGEF